MEKQDASTATAATISDDTQMGNMFSVEPSLATVGKEKKKKRLVSPPQVPPNLLKEVFLKKIFYLDRSLSKFAVVGVFERLDRKLGLLVRSGRSFIFWDFDTFNQMSVHFDKITKSLRNTESSSKFKITANGNEITIRKVFAKWYVLVRDKKRRNILLNESEWTQLLCNLPQIQKHFSELFVCENPIHSFVDLLIAAKDDDDAIPPKGLPSHLVNQLVDEVLFFKKWILWRP